MPAFVASHDLDAASYCEAKQRDEGILEANAIYIVVPRPKNEFPCALIASQEAIENGQVDLRSGNNFLRRANVFGLSRGLYEMFDEPLVEADGLDFFYRRRWLVRECTRNRR